MIPRQLVFEHHQLDLLFNSIGLNRLISVLLNLSRSVADFGLLDDQSKFDRLDRSTSKITKKIVKIFNELDRWIDEIPLDKDPQRFGNKSFRIWGNRLETEAERLHNDLIDSYHLVIQPELLFYFKNSFGSFSRLDYGTGHEVSFLAYLSILHLTRILKNEDLLSSVLVIYQRYLDICRKLQDYYRLEPAGSKGVYGLDDHFHLVYIFGSAQLLNVQTINPSQIIDKKFLETPNLSQSSLFFGAINHINKLKRGPFFEHSPILYNVATTVKIWSKVHSGMIKMWKGEVLSKVQVMQHFWLVDGLDSGVLSRVHVKEINERFDDDISNDD
ncbi:hypothetical protein PPACK8108_LOCUS10361 [Phakopsora pachyrhizi]|uniref:Serine/threonine-protein phosphatase 2A activator n=1 Tax=Phakopsora pachyrhizi TaxID=170000 RepID=A0AAV0B364_PHAPC|nr:hypothetical protein PPACK8108_LOCUS10361 [Phakopsora pachyrhizi]